MKLTGTAIRHSHRGGRGRDLIDPFLSDNPSWTKVERLPAARTSTQGGDRMKAMCDGSGCGTAGVKLVEPEPRRDKRRSLFDSCVGIHRG